MQPVTRKRSSYFVPQIHKRFARIEKRTSDTKRFFRKAGSGTGFRDGIPGIRKKVFGMAVDHLTGGGQMQSLIGAMKQFHVQLFFQCVNLFHDRRCGQILVCTAGEGVYQEWGKEPQILHPGDAVYIKPGVKHYHGAAADSWFSHIAVECPGENCSNEWCEPVTDEQYNRAVK